MIQYNKLYGGRFLTVALFSILSIAGIAFSIYLFYVANSFSAYVLAAAFTALSLIAGFFNIYASMLYFKSYTYGKHFNRLKAGLKPISRFPSVAIAIPVFNEDPKMVERNVKSFKTLAYPKSKLKFYLVDDSTDSEIAKGLESVAKRHGLVYLHRDERRGFKAGAINEMAKVSNEEFIAIFDSDETLTNNRFLLDLLPYFGNPKISYVQTEKRYKKGTFFSESIDIFDAFFFNFIQPARALNNTAIFAGSCGLIRKSAFEDIGGFPEFVIEDTFFSFESDMHGWQSLYVPECYAKGRPVYTFTELAKQQWRYNYGDTQFLGYYLKRGGYKKMSPLSNVEYTVHGFGLNYLSTILILFTLVSALVVFTSLPFAHVDLHSLILQNKWSVDLETLGFFAFTLSLLTPALLTRIYFGSWKKGFMVFLLNYALAFVRAKAAVATFLKRNPAMKWNKHRNSLVTEKKILTIISNTKTEVAFGTSMFVLSLFALAQLNLAGGIWLFWYGILYSLTAIFLYKYG